MPTDSKSKILERVRALLAKADSTQFPAEADAFRAKADELMVAYAIEQWQVDAHAAGATERTMPERRDFDLSWWRNSPRASELWALMQRVAHHCRCRLIWWGYGGQDIPAVGLPSDLDYFDMLFTHLMLQMGKGLEPKPDPAKPMIENLVTMKEAGMKWERIGELLWAVGQLDEPYTRNTGVRFTKLYTDYCAEHNRPRLRTSPQVYQRSYSQGFVQEVATRLRHQEELRRERSNGSGMELALRDIRTVVDETATDLFGRPPRSRSRAIARDTKTDWNAYATGAEAGRKADIAGNPQSGMSSRRSGALEA